MVTARVRHGLGLRLAGGLVALAAGAALLAGCTSGPQIAGSGGDSPVPRGTPEAPSSGPSYRAHAPMVTPPSDPAHDPRALTGTWRVSQTGSRDDGSNLELGPSPVLHSPCGEIEYGAVMAPSGEFHAAMRMSPQSCLGDDNWLTRSDSFTVTKAGIELRGAGELQALLLPEGTRPSVATNSPLSPARLTLPAGLHAPTPAELQRDWRAPHTNEVNAKAGATFKPRGEWSGSDGCNGLGGNWALWDNGWFMTSPPGMITSIGCDNLPVYDWVSGAKQVGLTSDERTLVLLRADGTESGRLVAR